MNRTLEREKNEEEMEAFSYFSHILFGGLENKLFVSWIKLPIHEKRRKVLLIIPFYIRMN